MISKLRERHLSRHNARVARILTDARKSETDRFWDAMDEMEKEAKILRQCLDGHSRSKLGSYMEVMIRDGLLTREDLGQFSTETQAALANIIAR